ncbi:type II toxin-antitoxin system HigB family toxin [Nostoc sp.]
MHIISFRILRKYAETHADCQEALNNWYKVATKAKWSNLVEVQQVFPKAKRLFEKWLAVILGTY